MDPLLLLVVLYLNWTLYSILYYTVRGDTFLKNLINFGHCPKRGGGPPMSEVLYKISYDYKFVYFTCSHDREVHIGEQSH